MSMAGEDRRGRLEREEARIAGGGGGGSSLRVGVAAKRLESGCVGAEQFERTGGSDKMMKYQMNSER